MSESEQKEIERLVRIRLIRLNGVVQGLALGAICGIGVFVATAWLLVKGGPVVGPHLSLLGQYFIGYEVSWVGSIIGLLWGFAVGFAVGFGVSALYNRIAALRPS